MSSRAINDYVTRRSQRHYQDRGPQEAQSDLYRLRGQIGHERANELSLAIDNAKRPGNGRWLYPA